MGVRLEPAAREVRRRLDVSVAMAVAMTVTMAVTVAMAVTMVMVVFCEATVSRTDSRSWHEGGCSRTMQKADADEIQAKSDTAHDEDEPRILNGCDGRISARQRLGEAVDHREPTLDIDESRDGLLQNADPKGDEEAAIEKGAQQPSPLPSKRQVLRRHAPLRDLASPSAQRGLDRRVWETNLQGYESHDEADEVIQLPRS